MYLGNTTVAGTLGVVGAATATTQPAADNSAKLATTAYVYQATAAAATIATTGGSTTLTAAQYGLPVIVATGALTGPATFVVPNTGQWSVENQLTGGYPLLVATAAGTGVVVPQGATMRLVADGTNVVAVGGKNPLAFQPLGAVASGGALPFLWGRAINLGNGFAADVAGPGTSQIGFTPTVACTGLRWLFQNYNTSGNGDGNAPNPVTLSAALWDGTALYPIMFGGHPTVTLGVRGQIWTDPLGYTAAGPAVFTGYISGTTLTVVSVLSGTIAANTTLRGQGVLWGQNIQSGSGSTWTLFYPQTLGSAGTPVTMFAGPIYWLRTYPQVAVAPTGPTCTAANSGGTLAAATYFYKITAVCGAQGESGGSTEVSGTTTGTGTMALTWAVDQRSVSPQSFNVYRGSATGAESFLCNVGLPQVNAAGQYAWTDTGAIANGVNAQATASAMSATATMTLTATASGNPAAGMYVFGTGIAAGTKVSALGTFNGTSGTLTLSAAQTISGETVQFANPVPPAQSVSIGATAPGLNYLQEGLNGAAYSGNASNQLATLSNGWRSASSGQFFTAVEMAGIPLAPLGKPVIVGIVGDSIEAGTTSAGLSTTDRGPAVQALAGLNIPYRLLAKTGDELVYQSQAATFRSRAQMLAGCTHVIIETVTNDIFPGGQTQAQVEANLMTVATLAAGQGAKVFCVTCIPRVTLTSGSGTTVSGQTAQAGEAVRQAHNNWVRAGGPISPTTLAPVAIGTGGAILFGQAGHPIAGYIDYAAQVEVNASNVLTVNGGFYGVWPLGSTPPGTPGTQDGVHPTSFVQGTCTGSISGTTLTLTAGTVYLGSILTGTGVSAGTQVLSGSGSTWTVSISQTVASTTITYTPAANVQLALSAALGAGLFA
jgi:hypothetical protein